MAQLKANKNLGQHFLIDKGVVLDTIALLEKNWCGEQIYEIGPGTGALTSELVPKFLSHLTCIEFDSRCVQSIKKQYPELQDKIIEADFLQLSGRSLFQEPSIVIGNFPYNISSQIIFKILDNYEHIPVAIGMFQKEVAERLAAKHGNKVYGVITVFAQLLYDIDIAFHITPDKFDPPPKVMSSVIILKRKTVLPEVNMEKLRKVVKAGFSMRRKKLRNALAGVFDPKVLDEPFFQQRAEELSIEDFIRLSERI
ncbi:MAG: 16S rRNA (adenine(1518)-N(6)/adenine(1519)-N(6))-dimethyltransferase RsmA [Chitinophagales bacterium]|nr:16S rRNA (adenine(1518)-N(6)/adenine(1519)-N(6))-dimethyltransferase RsmA [Chitinophagales bacterium]